MKTTANKNRTTRFAAFTCATMILGTISFAQPNPGTYNNSLINAQKKLKAAVEMMEESLSYETPAFNDWAAIAIYKVKLDAWAARTEEMLKYRAPSIEAAEAVEIKRDLKAWADNAKNSLRYEAPSAEVIEVAEARTELQTSAGEFARVASYEAPSIEAVEAREALSELKASAEKIRQSLCYEAPSVKSVETEEALEKLNVLAENAVNQIRYIAPTLEEVEAEEARQYLAAFAEKTVHEALAYFPDHPAVFAFTYASPVKNHEITGEYLTLVPANR